MEIRSILQAGICLVSITATAGFLVKKYRKPPEDFPVWKWERRGVGTFLYPGVYAVLRHMPIRRFLPVRGERLERMQRLYIGELQESIVWRYYCQLGSWLLGMFLALQFAFLFLLLADSDGGLLQKNYLVEREEPGGMEKVLELEAWTDEMKQSVRIEVAARKYRPEEAEAHLAEAREYVLSHYLSTNRDAEHVTEPLQLMQHIPGSQIGIEWETAGNGIVNADGTLNNQELEETVQTSVTAVLIYEDRKEELVLPVLVLPQKKSAEQNFWEEWEQEKKRLESATENDTLYRLPEKVNGKKVFYREQKSHIIWPLCLVLLGLCLLLPTLLDYRHTQQMQARQKELQSQYSDMIDYFTLYIGAGLSVRGAWLRITDDYLLQREQGQKEKSYLYEEMLATRRDMENGMSERKAYEAFGRRISLLAYMKFSALLVQNLRKGSRDILLRMERESRNAMQEKRESVKVRGEEAGTRLLFPMMVMLIIVFSMILAAAFYQM